MTGRRWRLAMPMYNVSPDVAQAWEALLCAVVAGLRRRGWTDEMDIVPAPQDLHTFWRSPDVLLTQTCGYPYVTELSDSVRLIATPRMNWPGCADSRYASFVVVRESAPYQSLADLRDCVAVINQPNSQSGMNALRHALAPLATHGRFFAQVHESGAHLNSLQWVQSGQADVAAVDCVTYGLAQRYAPKWVEGIRVLHVTSLTPGLPLIASNGVTHQQSADLLATLQSLAFDAPKPLEFLQVSGFAAATFDSYHAISEQIQYANNLGYPQLR
jgi:ABC-type phosphate/phosphonate transport system substrate-binding protein